MKIYVECIVGTFLGIITFSTILWMVLEKLLPFKCAGCKKRFFRFRMAGFARRGETRNFYYCKNCHLLRTMRHKTANDVETLNIAQSHDYLLFPIATLLVVTGVMWFLDFLDRKMPAPKPKKVANL